ncbi:MAG: DUF3048 domain-containing protein [Eubacteriales bacterium]|nr:DUF3048 domain-containing protein [Eubacteriales bacterium]
MKPGKTRFSLFLLALILTISTFSCPVFAEKEIATYNPLTGLALSDPNLVSARPVAIMINNIKKATPQVGLSAADILYELEVEGSITRQMAVYASASMVPEVGSIRSLRHDFIELAGAFDAIVVHFGGSTVAYDTVKNLGIEHIDSSNAGYAYWRDPIWRKLRGYEHSVKTNGPNLVKAINKLGLRTTNDNNNRAWFYFQPNTSIVPASGGIANSVSAPFSNYNIATFNYDAKTQTYGKGQFGKAQIDQTTGQQLKFTNVLLLKTTVTSYAGSILREYDLTSGSGYYLSGGKYENITWRKGGINDPWILLKADGTELTLNRGKTYIGVSNISKAVTFK